MKAIFKKRADEKHVADVIELGALSTETKGGFGDSVFDGGGGYYF